MIVRPINPGANGPWHFHVRRNESGFWPDFHTALLCGRVRIWNKTSDALAVKTEDWSVCNNFFASMIGSLWVAINGSIFRDSTPANYAWKSYFINLFNVSKAVKEMMLTPLDWSKDDLGKFALTTVETVIADAGGVATKTEQALIDVYNSALAKRREQFFAPNENGWVHFQIPLVSEKCLAGFFFF